MPKNTLYMNKYDTEFVSEIKDSRPGYFCDQCHASFFTQKGLQTHSQRQHGVYCETCPIDSFVEKVAGLFRHK